MLKFRVKLTYKLHFAKNVNGKKWENNVITEIKRAFFARLYDYYSIGNNLAINGSEVRYDTMIESCSFSYDEKEQDLFLYINDDHIDWSNKMNKNNSYEENEKQYFGGFEGIQNFQDKINLLLMQVDNETKSYIKNNQSKFS